MWEYERPRYDHAIRIDFEIKLVYPNYDHQVIQSVRKSHDGCSVFVDNDKEAGVKVVSISAVETYGQLETFRAAMMLLPHCVYKLGPSEYAVDFLVEGSQKRWLRKEDKVDKFWEDQQDVAMVFKEEHLIGNQVVTISSGRNEEAVRNAFSNFLLRWRRSQFKRPSIFDFNSIDVEDTYVGPRIDGDAVTIEFVMAMIDHFKSQRMIHHRYVHQIVAKAIDIFEKSASLSPITVGHNRHITVCGDIHGQFFDLINIFDLNGYPSKSNPYLFNGDFVDRGAHSVEVILTLYAFKAFCPEAMYLTRGNHESDGMNETHGFHDEVCSKLGNRCIKLFSESFCFLPLAHLINDRIFVVHGGLCSRDGVSLSDIRDLYRFRQPPREGLMFDLLWSDPQESLGRAPNKLRGCGVLFGRDVTRRFLEANNLDLLIRSHELKDDGYEVTHDGQLITIFSAPSYHRGKYDNDGAFIRFTSPKLSPEISCFKSVVYSAK